MSHQLRVFITPYFLKPRRLVRVSVGDKAKVFSDGRFLTDGRVDRIVKIAGKRLSLDDMETRLNNHLPGSPTEPL